MPSSGGFFGTAPCWSKTKKKKTEQQSVQFSVQVSPQSFRTGDLSFQHVTHSHPDGLMADTLVVVFTVPWMMLLRHTHTQNTRYCCSCLCSQNNIKNWRWSTAVVLIHNSQTCGLQVTASPPPADGAICKYAKFVWFQNEIEVPVVVLPSLYNEVCKQTHTDTVPVQSQARCGRDSQSSETGWRWGRTRCSGPDSKLDQPTS